MGRILILANFDLGLYKFRKDLIAELMKEGNEIYISLPYGKLVEPLKKMGCIFLDTSVDRRGINPVTDGKLFFCYIKMIRKIRPDYIISYTIKPNIYGGIAAAISKVPYALNITGLGTAFQKDGFVKKLVCFLYKTTCRKAHTVFFENEDNRRTFLKYHLVNEEKTYRLNGAGINLEEYPYTPYPEIEDEIRFLFIGRIMKEKGVDELFEAARKIRNQYPQAVFELVGLYEDDYKERIEQLEKEGVVRFYGYQEDVRPFIAKAHCFVLPSYHEGMANTLLESAAMCRPLITSRIHGCMEAVEDGKSGYLVRVKDSDELEEKIRDFIELDWMQKERFGIRSREIMEEKFEKGMVVGETVTAIKQNK
ncbi:MAG: glycosyltransferase family 4 protein [Lachnospiraceae bacterium]|nr:glycosyltransferase family 4 protein [Lachnospiraceae bacterium]